MSEEDRVPDLYAECDALGELPADLDPARREALDADPGCTSRRGEIEESNRYILEEHPVDQMVACIRERMRRAPARRSAWPRVAVVAATAVAVAAMALFVFLPAGRTEREARNPGETILLKGDPRLVVHRRIGQGSEPLDPGDPVRPGDWLQLSYMPFEAAHGVILSIDGRGRVTLHFPPDEAGSTALERGERIPLPFSYELDDAPGFERFLFVTSAEPIPVREVIEAAGKLGVDPEAPLELHGRWKQKSFLLKKP
jgi:hypothetical protein